MPGRFFLPGTRPSVCFETSAAPQYGPVSVVLISPNISLLDERFRVAKKVGYNFKYTESLYIIDIKSGLGCQFQLAPL